MGAGHQLPKKNKSLNLKDLTFKAEATQEQLEATKNHFVIALFLHLAQEQTTERKFTAVHCSDALTAAF